MSERVQQLVAECRRQEDSCRYTSATLFEWLKSLRKWRFFFVVAPIIAGALSALLTQQAADSALTLKWFSAVLALIAGVTTAIYKALNFDVSLDAISKTAHEYKVLQDRFRQAARILSLGDSESLESRFAELADRMDLVRSNSLTPPERFFKAAQKKIEAGDYTFDIDQRASLGHGGE